eukprot:1142786-Pelagomonas_calceolata.AAC.2
MELDFLKMLDITKDLADALAYLHAQVLNSWTSGKFYTISTGRCPYVRVAVKGKESTASKSVSIRWLGEGARFFHPKQKLGQSSSLLPPIPGQSWVNHLPSSLPSQAKIGSIIFPPPTIWTSLLVRKNC